MIKILKIIFFSGIFLLCATNLVFAAESVKINLSEAINLALENNRAIEQSAEDREAARWNLSAARRSSGLRLSWSSSASRIGGRMYNSMRENRYYFEGMSSQERAYRGYTLAQFPKYLSENTNNLSLSIPLYSGGRLEGQRKAAEYNLNAADLTLENTRQEVKWRTAQAYYQILQYNDLMNVRQEEMNNLFEHLKTVQIQYEVGTVAMSDVLATNVQLANSQQAYNSAQASYENAVATLNDLIGLPVDTNLVIDDELKYSPYNEDEEYCLEYALNHRPDGIAATYAVKSSAETVNQAKAGARPNLSAVVSGSMTGEGAFKADHSGGYERWSAGVELSWDIFDNKVTSAQVKAAKAVQRKAESQAKQQLEQIRLEVHNAYTNLRIAEQNIKVTAGAINQAREQYLIATVRYEEGVDTNLNVMDAQEKLTQARTNYFDALYYYNTSRAQLEKAMGIPIGIDAAIYAAAVAERKTSEKALEVSKVED